MSEIPQTGKCHIFLKLESVELVKAGKCLNYLKLLSVRTGKYQSWSKLESVINYSNWKFVKINFTHYQTSLAQSYHFLHITYIDKHGITWGVSYFLLLSNFSIFDNFQFILNMKQIISDAFQFRFYLTLSSFENF